MGNRFGANQNSLSIEASAATPWFPAHRSSSQEFRQNSNPISSTKGSLLALQFSHFLRRLLPHAKNGLPRYGSSPPFQGSTTLRPQFPKAATLRIASFAPSTRAMAAISASA